MSKLSKEERLARLQQNLNKCKSWADVDKELSLEITQVEKEFKIQIDGSYPLMKFQQMVDDLHILGKREEKAMNKSKGRTPRKR